MRANPSSVAETAPEASVDRLALVAEASAVLSRSSDVDAILRDLARLVVPALGDLVSVALLQPEGVLERVATHAADPHVAALIDEAGHRYPPSTRPGTPYHEVLTRQRPLLVPQITDEMLRAASQDEEHLRLVRSLGYRSVCVAPILHDGACAGTVLLATDASSGRTLGRADEAVLVDLAQRVGAALANARALARQEALREKLALLAEAGASLVAQRDRAGVVEAILGLSGRLLEADAFAVWLQRPDGAWHIEASRGLSPGYVRDVVAAMNHDAPLPDRAFRLGQDPSPPVRESHRQVREREGIRETLVFPLRVRDRPDGTIAFYYRRPFKPAPEDLRLGETLAALAGAAVANAEAYEARDRIEARLRENEAWLQGIYASLADAVIVLRLPEGVIERVNPATTAIFGHEERELVGRSTRVLHVDDAGYEESVRLSSLRLAEGSSASFQLPMRRKDGTVFPAEHAIRVLHAPDGRRLGAVSVVRDISERVRAEQALRASDARLRTLIEQSPYSIQTLSLDGHVTSGNPAWERLFGVTVEQVRDYNVFRDPQLEALGVLPLVRRAFEGETVTLPPTGWTPDRGERKGRMLWLQATLYPIRDHESRITQVALMHLDITAQTEARQEVDAVRAQLLQNEKLAALGSLVGGVAHELRTPLTYLSNNLHIVESTLRRALATPDPAALDEARAAIEERLREAREGIDRIERIVEDLRRFTRLKAGGRVREPVREAVEGALDLFRATHRGSVAVVPDLRSRAPVLVDRVQVQQVLLNLLSNAAEAGPRDGVVRVRTRDDAGSVVIEVEDAGVGMTAETLARAFDPFFTTKTEGTGLGLSIVKRIVEAHGGAISARSEPGVGTTFCVMIPAAE